MKWTGTLWRFGAIFLVSLLALQLFFLLRIAAMRWIDPTSTSFQRSSFYLLASSHALRLPWQQKWQSYASIGLPLKRAIIAAEDASFTEHDGVDWVAIERAWEKNQMAQKLADKAAEGAAKKSNAKVAEKVPVKPPKTVGGSTITQQLAKNLFLSPERTYGRKAQEFVLVLMLEALLSKQRIFEIYLNHVEWGEGIYGAEAAAKKYFQKSAAKLAANEAAMLAGMLPRPKYFERRLHSSDYLRNQSELIQSRMYDVEIP